MPLPAKSLRPPVPFNLVDIAPEIRVIEANFAKSLRSHQETTPVERHHLGSGIYMFRTATVTIDRYAGECKADAGNDVGPFQDSVLNLPNFSQVDTRADLPNRGMFLEIGHQL